MVLITAEDLVVQTREVVNVVRENNKAALVGKDNLGRICNTQVSTVSCGSCFVSPPTYRVSKEDLYVLVKIEFDISHVAGKEDTSSSSNRGLGSDGFLLRSLIDGQNNRIEHHALERE